MWTALLVLPSQFYYYIAGNHDPEKVLRLMLSCHVHCFRDMAYCIIILLFSLDIHEIV